MNLNQMFVKLSCLLLFLFITTFLSAQQSDTLVVYDYQYVTDTIWVEQEISSIQSSPQEQLLSFNWDRTKLDLSDIPSVAAKTSSEVSTSKGIEWTQFKDHLSFVLKGNAAMQTHWTDKTYGRDGEFPIATFGFSAASSYHINKFIAFEPKLSFLQKGCQLGYLYDSIDSEGNTKTKIEYDEFQNRFNYLSFDLIFKFGKNANYKFSPHLYGGLRGDLLLWNKVEYLVDQLSFDDPILQQLYTSTTDYKDFHRFNYGWVAGFGAEIRNKWFLQLELNSDIGYLAKGYKFRVQNSMISANLGVYLSALKK